MQPTLFQQALGASFFNLPAPVRSLHAVRGSARYAGIASVQRGRNPLARLCARVAGLPGTMQDVPITVEFTADARGETWRRDFAGTGMQSRLAFKDGLLHVQAGAGIVADSVPTSEWEETMNKGRALFRAAELAERGLDEPRPVGEQE